MTRPYSLILSAADIETILSALEASQEYGLAFRIERQRDTEKRARAGQEEAAKALAEYRAERANGYVLNKRQAEALAAIRAGKNAFYRWEDGWMRGWRHSNRMGGATSRMVDSLVEEGVLLDALTMTEAGRARLEAWEVKHGKIGEDAK